jgi:hypothetical protein
MALLCCLFVVLGDRVGGQTKNPYSEPRPSRSYQPAFGGRFKANSIANENLAQAIPDDKSKPHLVATYLWFPCGLKEQVPSYARLCLLLKEDEAYRALPSDLARWFLTMAVRGT